MGHLADLEPLWNGRLDDFLAEKDELRPADLANTATHEANHNAASLAALCTRVRSAREAFLARLAALDEDDFRRTALHPRLKQPMRLLDLCLFVAAHDDCHLARMYALRQRG